LPAAWAPDTESAEAKAAAAAAAVIVKRGERANPTSWGERGLRRRGGLRKASRVTGNSIVIRRTIGI